MAKWWLMILLALAPALAWTSTLKLGSIQHGPDPVGQVPLVVIREDADYDAP